MAGATLLTLLDDIAAILDDIALMTKTATQKTAGVLGDDLLNTDYASRALDPQGSWELIRRMTEGGPSQEALRDSPVPAEHGQSRRTGE